mmetsp:Transcript_25786/g.38439  ORF Transcript_25786/g.38439 Transcript_25786/m.38439 type:complete len:204 (+) Transcript_25786:44-655(+)
MKEITAKILILHTETIIIIQSPSLSLHGCNCNIRQSNPKPTLPRLKRTLQNSRSPLPHIQHITPLHTIPQRLHLIRHNTIPPMHHSPIQSNHRSITIRSTPQIIKNPRQNRPLDQFHRLLLLQIILKPLLKHCHGRQRSRSHGSKWQFTGRPMRINLIQMWSIHITPTQHQCRTHIPLITKQHPFQHGACRHNPRLSISGIHT